MRRSPGTGVAALSLVLLVGCGGSGADSGGADLGTGGVAAPEVAPGGAAAGPEGTDADRQVLTTATASVTVEDPAEGAQRVSELVESVGGRVDERTEQAVSGDDGVQGTTADLVVRVPSDELTGVLADLADLGDVENVSVSRSDVTSQAVDLDARISALQASVARLRALIDGAASTQALLEVEQALSERQEKLESLQSQRALLADQVDLSTLSVRLEPVGLAPAGGPEGFVEGLGTGWRALLTVLSGTVVVLGILLPWLTLAALVTLAVLVPVRMLRRRAVVVAPAAPGPPTPQGPPMPPAQG